MLLTLLACQLDGQHFHAWQKAAAEALAQKDHHAAIWYLGKALELKPDATGVQYQLGELAYQIGAYDLAASYLNQVLESPESAAFPSARFYLAKTAKSTGNYDLAIAHFQAYLNSVQTDASFWEPARIEMEQCQWAKQQKADERIEIRHLGKQVNTAYSEFAPFKIGDSLYYSSLRFDWEKDKYQPARKLSRLLLAKGNARGRAYRHSALQLDTALIAHTAFSLNGARLYYTQCRYLNATEIRCAIFYLEKDKRGRWAAKPKALKGLSDDVNATYTQPAIGYDSLLQSEILLFASDRPGGAGGLDLWYGRLDNTGQLQGAPQALTQINTPQNDICPFFDTPNQKLFFSSDGYPTLGGYDIFQTNIPPTQAPMHLPAPINSSYHDIYYFSQDGGQSGYLASNRPGSFYLDENNKSCCHDLYFFQTREETPPDSVPSISHHIPVLPDGPPTLPNNLPPDKLEDFLPLALYFDNDEPDRRTRREFTRKSYTETFEAYAEKEAAYLNHFSEDLAPEDQAIAGLEIAQFFQEVEKGQQYLMLFSDILLERLESGDKVEIFVKGYTSPRAESDYNLALSKRRISSVKNHFYTYKNSAFQNYIENGQLVISERPFGESLAAHTVSDALDDWRNSIYHPDAARERRVEILEVRFFE